MSIDLATPTAADLADHLRQMRPWQRAGTPVPLHPGDLGWAWRLGAPATAAAVRTWSRAGELLALGFLDGPGLLRLAVAPAAEHDEGLARALVADVADPDRGVLPAGAASIEARSAPAVRAALRTAGWRDGETWTPLVWSLTEPVRDGAPATGGVSVAVVGPDLVEERAAVHRAAFERSTFDAQMWRTMAAGPEYAYARCLLVRDRAGTPVAAATVWSAGPGRPGLLEPVGAHRDHRGRGYGRIVMAAAAAALRELGATSAVVCTPSSNTVAIGAYRSAGFTALPEVCDLTRAG